MNYIFNTIFQYRDTRLPHTLFLMILNTNIFWVNQLNDVDIQFDVNVDREEWIRRAAALVQELEFKSYNEY